VRQWTLGDIAACLGTLLPHHQPDTFVSGISTDSRTLEPGSLFVPLVGDRFDGHNYVRKAIEEHGAASIVWGRDEVPGWLASNTKVAVFRVSDTLKAYQSLGLYWKNLCDVKCVAVTGSVGKTTTKEFLAHFLSTRFKVHKSQANFNNDIGVPKTLLQLQPEHQVVIVEMGMRGRGEIARLVKSSEPDVGIITAIGTSHLELLGSRENIARAKGELVEGLSADGCAVLPKSDEFFSLLAALSQAPVTSYSVAPGAGADLAPDSVLSRDAESTTFVYGGREYRLPLPGEHHLHDLFAVLTAGRALGLSVSEMLEALPSLSNPDGRAEWVELAGARFFLDAYNSAPESLRASLGVLKSCSSRRVAVLGDMLELGTDGPRIHREIGASLEQYGVDLALCFGPLSEGMAQQALSAGINAHWFAEKDDLTDFLSRELQIGDSVLVKASRGMALETVVNAIKERVG
jgi:UDP-N-acetylmuramoyl-tripeptide--D-alanyl-D-alanine ligase